ncbi:MAG: diguanylate cyclase domain-containing protein, partial [Tsuneonella sp.]
MTRVLRSIDGLRFGSLRLRIAVLYAGLFAVVLTAIVLIAGGALGRFGEESAARDLSASARVFDELLDLRATQMRRSADVLSRDFGFRQAVATHDAATIDSALESLKSRSQADAAFVVGIDGTLLASGDARVRAPAALWKPLDGGKDRGMIRLGDKIALAAAAPVEAPDLIGWLVLAQPLDRGELDRLTRLAAIDVHARVALARQLPPWLAGKNGQVVEQSEDGPSLYQASALPVLEQGLSPSLILDHSLKRSLAQFTGLQRFLAGLALAAVARVVLLSGRVARTVTEPLQKLDEATRLIGEGREFDVSVESDDEIGRLAASFTTMMAAIAERERRIIHVGLHDGLTGLPNRKLFVEQLDQALLRLRADEQLMVIYVDLDDFKVVNDTLGHPAGDALLRQVGETLREHLPEAAVARLGGDEFAILLHGIGPDTN